MADLFLVPSETRSCEECKYVLIGVTGEFCRLYLEDLVDVSVAEECDGYEE